MGADGLGMRLRVLLSAALVVLAYRVVNADGKADKYLKEITTATGSPDIPDMAIRVDRQVVLSARICARQIQRAWCISEIAKERRYSRIGGVVNLHLLWRHQQTVKFDDIVIDKTRTLARSEKIALLPCTTGTLSEFLKCVRVRRLENCDGEIADLARRNDDGVEGVP